MLGDISGAANIYIVTGYTDMRKSIDGLCAIVMDQLKEEPDIHSIYLFCGRRGCYILPLVYRKRGTDNSNHCDKLLPDLLMLAYGYFRE